MQPEEVRKYDKDCLFCLPFPVKAARKFMPGKRFLNQRKLIMKNKILFFAVALIFTVESMIAGYAHSDSCNQKNTLRPVSTSTSPDGLISNLKKATAQSDQFLKTVSRKTDNKGRFHLEGSRYNLGVDYADKDLVLSVYYKDSQPGDFSVLYEDKLIASYDAQSDQFLKTVSMPYNEFAQIPLTMNLRHIKAADNKFLSAA